VRFRTALGVRRIRGDCVNGLHSFPSIRDREVRIGCSQVCQGLLGLCRKASYMANTATFAFAPGGHRLIFRPGNRGGLSARRRDARPPRRPLNLGRSSSIKGARPGFARQSPVRQAPSGEGVARGGAWLTWLPTRLCLQIRPYAASKGESPALAGHRLPNVLVGLVAVEPLNVDLRGAGLLVAHHVGDLTSRPPLRGEPGTVGVP
jgi:hypothetical protein